MKYLIECLSCTKVVWVHLIQFGEGYVGVCPECSQLAYNSSSLPKGGD